MRASNRRPKSAAVGAGRDRIILMSVCGLLDILGTFFAALHSYASATEVYVGTTDINGQWKRPSVGASPSNGGFEDQQFARFLEAANHLGENLDTIFAASFAKIIANASLTP